MSKNETGKWVRVRPETLAALDRIGGRLTLAAADGHMTPWWAGDEPTNNEILVRLIGQYEAKQRRAKKARKNAKRRRELEALEDILVPASGYYVDPDGRMRPHPLAGERKAVDNVE